jgi:hypothetical protein
MNESNDDKKRNAVIKIKRTCSLYLNTEEGEYV